MKITSRHGAHQKMAEASGGASEWRWFGWMGDAPV